MGNYLQKLKDSLASWQLGLVLILTICRVYYGYKWLTSGIGKLTWLTDGKLNSSGYIGKMIENMTTDHGDPFKIGRLYAKIADAVFLNMPNLTDALVVIFELLIGVMLIIGFKLFWTLLAALFLNLQFFAAGSTNNFGYVITNLTIMKFVKYFDVIGLDGYLRNRKNKDLL